MILQDTPSLYNNFLNMFNISSPAPVSAPALSSCEPCNLCIRAIKAIWQGTKQNFRTKCQLKISTKKLCTKLEKTRNVIPAINYYCCTNQISVLVNWITSTMKPRAVCRKIRMC